MASDTEDEVARKLLDAERRFTEFGKTHEACGAENLHFQGDSQVRMLRCPKCGEACTVAGLSVEFFVEYLREVRGATATDIMRDVIPPGSKRPS